jgi:hypothetical protein
MIKIILFVKTKTSIKSRVDGWEDGRCGLVTEKRDRSATRGLIPMHVEEAEWKF